MAISRTPAELHALLVAQMRSTAKWRKAKAEEFADDYDSSTRSRRAAAALGYAANVVEAWDPGDDDLRWLAHADADSTRLVFCEEALDVLSRFGMGRGAWNRGVSHPDEVQIRKLLRRMAGADARERGAQRRDAS